MSAPGGAARARNEAPEALVGTVPVLHLILGIRVDLNGSGVSDRAEIVNSGENRGNESHPLRHLFKIAKILRNFTHAILLEQVRPLAVVGGE